MATTTPSANTANIVRIEGKAYVRAAQGELIALKAGDHVEQGQEVTIDPQGHMFLQLANGQTLDLGGGRTISATEELLGQVIVDRSEAAIRPGFSAEIQSVIAALDAGQDPLANLEAPGAGLTAGDAAEGGHSFVRLLRIVEEVTPLNYQFSSQAAETPVEFPANAAIEPLQSADEPAVVTPLTPATPSGPVLSVSSASAVEGSPAVFTVSLSSPSTSATIFTPSLASGAGLGGATVGVDTTTALEYYNGTSWVPVGTGGVTIAAGETSVQIRVATIDDEIQEGSETFTLNASITSGTTTSGLSAGASASGTATITDDVGPGLPGVPDAADTTHLSLSAAGSAAEGGQITYTATLTNPATSPLTVTLSNGSQIMIAAGQTVGTVSVPAPADNVYADAGTVSATISGTSGGNFEHLVVNPAPALTAINDTIDTTTATLTATPSVAEGGSITYTVALSSPVTGTPVTVALSNGQSVTIPVGDSSASITATAPDNAYTGGGSVSTSITSATGGNFESLVASATPAVTTVTDDADATTVTLTASSASVVEGGSVVYTATVSNPVTGAPLVISLSNGQSITIPVGSSSASSPAFAVRADDVHAQGDQTLAVSITGSSGGHYEALTTTSTVSTTVSDDADITTVSLTGETSVTEGHSATYTVALTSPAQSAVTVTLAYSGTAANGTDFTGTTTVTIPAGASSAAFSIPALADGSVEGTEAFTVSVVSAAGGGFEGLAVSGTANAVTTQIADADTATVSLSATSAITEAGGTIVYTATISSAPVSALTVTLDNGQSITIAAGATTGTVSVPVAASEDVYLDASSVSAAITAVSGGGINASFNPAPALTAINDTIDTTTATLTATPSVAEG
ncbi:retention module-containing protein, partial [Uliginosibacterium sp. 31-16]|uniref:retention module-containing protein n=1 Tax=Uliginosibacterium sp. 31-16 TaxID=3068315 RepID=UPI00273FA14E